MLEETYGVVVFHEQVLRIVATMTGCSLAEADETRRSWARPDGQDDVRAWFYPAALQRGYDLPTVERVWDVLRAFASFGFCKAHAAAFALPTYQSAWLKAHHPAAFLAGVLTHDPGMYPKRLILDDARNRGVAVLGLDVNASADVYRVERDPHRARRHPGPAHRRQGHQRGRGRRDRRRAALRLAVRLLAAQRDVPADGRAHHRGRRLRRAVRHRRPAGDAHPRAG